MKRVSSNCIRKRPVSFGNPALGVYHGNVYTLEEAQQQQQVSTMTTTERPLIEGAHSTQRLVCMVDVPPEQVPEGILNLARSHRPWIHHVRIVIAEADQERDKDCDVLDEGETKQETQQQQTDSVLSSLYSATPSSETSTTESAASILAAEQEVQKAEASSNETATKPSSRLIRRFHHRSSSVEVDDDNSHHATRTYLVLLELSTDDAANVLVDDLDNRPYTTLDETQVCRVHHVVALEGKNGVKMMSPFFAPGGLEILPSTSSETPNNSSSSNNSKNNNEDYHCAVCLEHMDLGVGSTSILTTVCNHSFHIECLIKWQDSPCPVCRYDHSGLNEALSQCHICGTTENNYVCLICGVVSCGGRRSGSSALAARRSSSGGDGGRRSEDTTITTPDCQTVTGEELDAAASQHQLRQSHARQHYDETLHAYALDTESQHVWDFAGQGYVHRLLQNKDDGKLVEVNDPNNMTSEERTLDPGLSDEQSELIVHRKLEGFASQYYTLLKSQLEQQRIYYEGRLEEIRREYTARRKRQTSDLLVALRQERQHMQHRLNSLKTKSRKVRDDVTFLKDMNESLEANKGPLKQQIENAQRERTETRKMFQELLPPLQEQVTRLMLQLESEMDSKKPPAQK